jgi:hypothetical protein
VNGGGFNFLGHDDSFHRFSSHYNPCI